MYFGQNRELAEVEGRCQHRRHFVMDHGRWADCGIKKIQVIQCGGITMSELVVGILGFACITGIVVTLFKSKTLPSIAFIVFPMILASVLVAGGYYTWDKIGSLIKG